MAAGPFASSTAAFVRKRAKLLRTSLIRNPANNRTSSYPQLPKGVNERVFATDGSGSNARRQGWRDAIHRARLPTYRTPCDAHKLSPQAMATGPLALSTAALRFRGARILACRVAIRGDIESRSANSDYR